MASLQRIRSRINSINTTKKLTKAMELVSSAKSKKARKQLDNIKEFCDSVKNTLFLIASEYRNSLLNFNNDNIKSKMYIVISSDLGLCGAYNTNIFKLLKDVIQPEDKLIIFGQKGVSLFKNNFLEQIDHSFIRFGDDPNYNLAKHVAKLIWESLEKKEIGQIHIAYTKFVNGATFEATLEQIFPYDLNSLDEQKIHQNITTLHPIKKNLSLIEFFPNKEEILLQLIPLYITSSIYGKMVESKLSEITSRRIAMENASNNAEELRKKLDLIFNQTRQSKITQEITEIIAGSSK